MNALIILYSYHHKNTEKIAKVIATSFGAEIKTPEQVDLNGISNFDFVVGSGLLWETSKSSRARRQTSRS